MNNNSNSNSPATATAEKTPATAKTFADLLTAFETDYINGNSNSPALVKLATTVAHSVLNKCIDPQRKTATERETVSNSGNSPALVALKREINVDSARLENFYTATANAIGAGYDKDGNYTPVVLDPALVASLDLIDGTATGDGLDLVNTAVVALLEVSAKYSASGAGYMTTPVTIRKLSKKVVIQSSASASFKDVETTPIQEVYKEVRRAIANSKAIATDPRNGYTYIADLATDPETNALETVYIRQGKFADLGGYDCNGLYSADKETADRTTDLLTRLELNTRQATVVSLRLRGYGNKAIATYLGIDPANVKRTLKQIQAKCVAIGFSPVGLASPETA